MLSKLNKWLWNLLAWAFVLGFTGSFVSIFLLLVYFEPYLFLPLLVCVLALTIFSVIETLFPIDNHYESPVDHMTNWGMSGGIFGGLYTALIIGWGNSTGFFLTYQAIATIVTVSFFALLFGSATGLITGMVLHRLLGEATAEKPFTWQRMRNKRLPAYGLMLIIPMIISLASAPLLIVSGEYFARELGLNYFMPHFLITGYLIPSLIASLICVYAAHRYMFRRNLRLIRDRLFSGKSKAKNASYHHLMDKPQVDEEVTSETEKLEQRSQQ